MDNETAALVLQIAKDIRELAESQQKTIAMLEKMVQSADRGTKKAPATTITRIDGDRPPFYRVIKQSLPDLGKYGVVAFFGDDFSTTKYLSECMSSSTGSPVTETELKTTDELDVLVAKHGDEDALLRYLRRVNSDSGFQVHIILAWHDHRAPIISDVTVVVSRVDGKISWLALPFNDASMDGTLEFGPA